ncbi:hypothetical protein SNEBB_005831 [Seison nebaliae]|nr:hypothetical protein SNEBB_005831 [Seison nebaliae]
MFGNNHQNIFGAKNLTNDSNKNPNSSLANSIFSQKTQSSPMFGSTTSTSTGANSGGNSGSLFGSGSSSSGMFGSNKSPLVSQPLSTASTIFRSANSGGGIFGNNQQTTTSTFGGQQNQKNIFGANTSNSSASNSLFKNNLFGTNTNNSTHTSSATTTTVNNTGQGLFASLNLNNAGNTTPNNQTNQKSLFEPKTTTGGIGGSTNLFSTTSTVPAGNTDSGMSSLFDKNLDQQKKPSTFSFNSQPTTTTSSLFSNIQSQPKQPSTTASTIHVVASTSGSAFSLFKMNPTNANTTTSTTPQMLNLFNKDSAKTTQSTLFPQLSTTTTNTINTNTLFKPPATSSISQLNFNVPTTNIANKSQSSLSFLSSTPAKLPLTSTTTTNVALNISSATTTSQPPATGVNNLTSLFNNKSAIGKPLSIPAVTSIPSVTSVGLGGVQGIIDSTKSSTNVTGNEAGEKKELVSILSNKTKNEEKTIVKSENTLSKKGTIFDENIPEVIMKMINNFQGNLKMQKSLHDQIESKLNEQTSSIDDKTKKNEIELTRNELMNLSSIVTTIVRTNLIDNEKKINSLKFESTEEMKVAELCQKLNGMNHEQVIDGSNERHCMQLSQQYLLNMMDKFENLIAQYSQQLQYLEKQVDYMFNANTKSQSDYNNLQIVVNLIQNCSKIIVTLGSRMYVLNSAVDKLHERFMEQMNKKQIIHDQLIQGKILKLNRKDFVSSNLAKYRSDGNVIQSIPNNINNETTLTNVDVSQNVGDVQNTNLNDTQNKSITHGTIGGVRKGPNLFPSNIEQKQMNPFLTSGNDGSTSISSFPSTPQFGKDSKQNKFLQEPVMNSTVLTKQQLDNSSFNGNSLSTTIMAAGTIKLPKSTPSLFGSDNNFAGANSDSSSIFDGNADGKRKIPNK